MNILLFGKGGQVGWELQRSLSVLDNVTALDFDSQEHCGDFSNPAVLGAVKVERGDLAQHRKAALQLPADLAAFAKEKDVHSLAPASW
jgi:dTDP-4-dehydrorhamnose reductase